MRGVAWLLPVALLLAACGGERGDGDEAGGSVLVFAAASLTDAFEEVATAFEGVHPGIDVELNFAGSSALREQILEGAPADVFASADESSVEDLIVAGEATWGSTFARNELAIVVPAGNQAGVVGLADFGRDELLIGLCAEEVPCGRFGREVLSNAGDSPAVDTDEPDVRALLSKVEAGELDAGLVYRTDVVAAGRAVEGIEVPPEDNVVAAYAITVPEGSSEPDIAEAFVMFVLSDEGRSILESYGFERP
jgi:molybdate transport system substrate-binding protein